MHIPYVYFLFSPYGRPLSLACTLGHLSMTSSTISLCLLSSIAGTQGMSLLTFHIVQMCSSLRGLSSPNSYSLKKHVLHFNCTRPDISAALLYSPTSVSAQCEQPVLCTSATPQLNWLQYAVNIDTLTPDSHTNRRVKDVISLSFRLTTKVMAHLLKVFNCHLFLVRLDMHMLCVHM